MKVQLLLLLALSAYSSQQDIDHGHSTGNVEKCPAIADIVFVLDVSGSVTAAGYAVAQNFVIRLTEHFLPGPHDVQFGLLTFSNTLNLRFTLGTYSTNAALKAAIQSVPYTGGGTRTDLALNYVREQGLLTTSRGAQVRSSKIAMVITDGLSEFPSYTTTAANALRASGVSVVAVGIGSTLNAELNNIAGNSQYVYSAKDFNSLLAIELLVATGTCKIPIDQGNVKTTTPAPTTTPKPTTPKPTTPKPTTPKPTTPKPTTKPNPCNPGYEPDPSNPKKCINIDECKGSHNCQQECYDRPGTYRCNCFEGFTIDPADKTKCIKLKPCVDPVDVYFLLDESDNVAPNSYKHIKRFPARMSNHFFFGETGAKYGAAKVATDVTDLFGLNTYDKRIQVADAFRATTRRGGDANIHLGLHHVFNDQVLAKGGRDAAPDIVVVVTTGPLASPDKAKAAADRVRSRGAHVVAVGAGPNLSRADLRGIGGSDKDTFLVPTLDDLDDVEKGVMEQICPSTRT